MSVYLRSDALEEFEALPQYCKIQLLSKYITTGHVDEDGCFKNDRYQCNFSSRYYYDRIRKRGGSFVELVKDKEDAPIKARDLIRAIDIQSKRLTKTSVEINQNNNERTKKCTRN